ncbi:hypothetical protein CH063_12566 [Colletotrichum higginsianum]|uniref:Uncharacterized protein n=1 Tax=Colletotrichum higginsianum (strain IMI 349063) TaxID=759273 RepID=H1VQW2_COLHI|nr:hypothetical protein CH63R_01010 [Colletotrichum higginsianum IMI 349063]OBR15830.1 hypothetical protein CH63R_01010 [Colletotrichum higginsianum IMI 349063]CCF42618.1 hypothetical protein CH063_12566 [Colletotrichum higginsianum]
MASGVQERRYANVTWKRPNPRRLHASTQFSQGPRVISSPTASSAIFVYITLGPSTSFHYSGIIQLRNIFQTWSQTFDVKIIKPPRQGTNWPSIL